MVLGKCLYLSIFMVILISTDNVVIAQPETTAVTTNDVTTTETTIGTTESGTNPMMQSSGSEPTTNNSTGDNSMTTDSSTTPASTSPANTNTEGSSMATDLQTSSATTAEEPDETTPEPTQSDADTTPSNADTTASPKNCSSRDRPGTWNPPSCNRSCGGGCPDNNCLVNGTCVTDETECTEGYRGLDCATPICDYDCSPGLCLAPNSCQVCGIHYASGETCRNIRLDGFLRGSLSTFAILTTVVVLLSVTSKWYVRRKVQQKVPQM